jgi:hypothetical protein
MKFFKQISYVALALIVLGQSTHALSCRFPSPPYVKQPLVQMAILLDTSNSMDGLIEQAKSQLWKIANDLAYSYRDGQRPILQVALYEYGNNWLSAGEGHIRQVLPFTTDMDQVSLKLFGLRTNGGQEYCGAVIKDAIGGLAWDRRPDVYKVIFIAGNEPFTQGPVDFREAIAKAVSKGVVINPIYCGRHAEGVQTQWYDGAIAGRGSYMNIDSNRAVVVMPTPYDDEISRLGGEINDTYVGYGGEGQRAMRAMYEADKAAALSAPAAAPVERSLFKATAQYSEVAWDAVSSVASGRMKVASMKREDLPAELKSKSDKELEKHLKDQNEKRQTLQNRLGELKKSREVFLAKQASANGRGELSLDQAIQKTVRDQASKLNFDFKN